MSREEWIGVGLVFAGALILLFVVAVLMVKAWHTEPEDVIRRTEDKRRPKENLAREVDLANRHFDRRRANEMTVRLPRQGQTAEPTVQVNVRHDSDEPWGWAK